HRCAPTHRLPPHLVDRPLHRGMRAGDGGPDEPHASQVVHVGHCETHAAALTAPAFTALLIRRPLRSTVTSAMPSISRREISTFTWTSPPPPAWRKSPMDSSCCMTVPVEPNLTSSGPSSPTSAQPGNAGPPEARSGTRPPPGTR